MFPIEPEGRKRWRHRFLAVALVLVLLGSQLAACSGGALRFKATPTPVVATPTIPAAATATNPVPAPSPASTWTAVTFSPTATPDLTYLLSPAVQVAARVRPAVVNITSQAIAYDLLLQPYPEDIGTGSGVIFREDGYIITNNHVVEQAEKLMVSLPDGRSFEGKLVGRDPRSDLAVVKIDGEKLPTAVLGDSDALQIGEQVVAIGNALALPGGPTVTVGVVGAIGRQIELPDGGVLYDLIQTDAAINPGNSGGPLVNLRSEVVGINTALAFAPGGGIGFAIAINAAKPIVEQLIEKGRVVRPWLGVGLVEVTPALARQYDLPVKRGVLITRVERGTPAARAGLRRGDIIVALDGEEMGTLVSLLKAIAKHAIGDTVKITFYRDNTQQTVEVTLAEMPAG